MASSPFFLHLYSLFQYMATACARCLGLGDSSRDTKPSNSNSTASQGEDEGKKKINEELAAIQVRAIRRKGPKRPAAPREGRGGDGGSHH